jgi:adenosyl cobinamide kinase/adenosyl cobinamide phosphate guanylyltransferase
VLGQRAERDIRVHRTRRRTAWNEVNEGTGSLSCLAQVDKTEKKMIRIFEPGGGSLS